MATDRFLELIFLKSVFKRSLLSALLDSQVFLRFDDFALVRTFMRGEVEVVSLMFTFVAFPKNF